MSEQVLGDLLCFLDKLVLERIPDGRILPVSPIPQWFRTLVADAESFPAGLPLVSAFLVDAEEFWAAGVPGRLDAGIIMEADASGAMYAIEVHALLSADRCFLMLGNRRDCAQIQAHSEPPREQALELRARQKPPRSLGKAEASRLDLESAPYCPARVAEEAAQLLQVLVREKKLELSVELADCKSLWIVGDAVRFRQVLLNLLHNAVKFTPRGSVRVTLRADMSAPATVRVEVHDTGIGVSKSQEARLFQPLSQ